MRGGLIGRRLRGRVAQHLDIGLRHRVGDLAVDECGVHYAVCLSVLAARYRRVPTQLNRRRN
jgi:hypothetical protein